MFVTLFRHAERENSGAENPGLTARGQRQAASLISLVEQNLLIKPKRLLASPKKRTAQTFEPLAQKLKLSIEIAADINERQNSESPEQFQARVARFIDRIEHIQESVYVCSHLDWIEEALLKIPSDVDLLQSQFQVWAPGQFAQFEIYDKVWTFKKTGGLLP